MLTLLANILRTNRGILESECSTCPGSSLLRPMTSMVRACLFLLIWVLMGCADNTIFRVDASIPIFTITLPGNATTGYRWSVTTYNTHFFRLKGSQYIASSTNRIGSGGNFIFTFVLLSGQSYPESTHMTFTYARSWDARSGNVKKVKIYFVQPLGAMRLKGK